MPLIHTRCSVIKVHGDYLDTRIRNTLTELESYSPEFDALLDRVFDEFGLIVSGWSADWDTALRKAITRSVSRRFSHFWAIRSKTGDKASGLIQHRQAQTILTADADSFFSELDRLVEALDQFSKPHPLSTEAAVASLKGYLTEEKYRIRLNDLVSTEIDKILEAISGPAFTLQGGSVPNTQTFTARVRAYDAACETLVAMALVGGYWIEDWHYTTWNTALLKLATPRGNGGRGGYVIWEELQRYPATLLFYALGLGAIEAGERGLLFLNKLFVVHVERENQKDKTAVELLPPFCLFSNKAAHLLEGMERNHAPLTDWLQTYFKPKMLAFSPSEAQFSFAFDRLEVLMALGYARHVKRSADWYWAPPGAYGYRHDNWARILAEIRNSLNSLVDKSPYVQSGIFGDSAAECGAALDALMTFVIKLNQSWL
jgi:hypothetical protein